MAMFVVGRKPVVSVLRLSGVISAGAGLGRRGLSLEALAAPIQHAFTGRRVKAVALAINSVSYTHLLASITCRAGPRR